MKPVSNIALAVKAEIAKRKGKPDPKVRAALLKARK